MNIFVVHWSPQRAAQMLCDQHVVKMPSEGVQILCTAHELQRRRKRALLVSEIVGYPQVATRRAKLEKLREELDRLEAHPHMPWQPARPLEHRQHPVVNWVQAKPGNILWLINHTRALFEEYEYRFHRTHGSFEAFEIALKIKRESFPWKFASRHQRLKARSSWEWPAFYRNMTFCQCMPEEYQVRAKRHAGTTEAYRRFYIMDKSQFARWTNGRPPPDWWPFSTNRPPHGNLLPCPSAKAETSASANP
jgi:hypothetical protein